MPNTIHIHQFSFQLSLIQVDYVYFIDLPTEYNISCNFPFFLLLVRIINSVSLLPVAVTHLTLYDLI